MAQLSAQGPIGAPHATSEVTTDAQLALGTRMRDVAGNEYVYVSFGEVIRAGQWVHLRNATVAGGAVRVASTTAGPVGIVTADASSNDNGWVQVYGTYPTAQVDDSEATSAFLLAAPGGATTEAALQASSVADVANQVFNAWITSAASTATTGSSSAHTGITVAVTLNFPFLTGWDTQTDTTIGTT